MSEIKTARLPSHQHLQYLQLVQELPPLSSPQQPETEKKKKTSFSQRKRLKIISNSYVYQIQIKVT